jgi:hypothetical protein
MKNKDSKLTIDVRPVEMVQAPDFWLWVDAIWLVVSGTPDVLC